MTSRVNIKVAFLTGVVALLGALVAAAAVRPAESAAAPLTACVNKKSGAVKMVSGKKAKKCPRGWRKVDWNGGTGPNVWVYDATGKKVGRFLGSQVYGPYLVFEILRGGGIYEYVSGGALFPSGAFMGGTGAEPLFTTADCSGKAYIEGLSTGPPAIINLLKRSVAGTNRIVFRPIQPSGLGVPRAWKGDGTVVTVSAPIPTFSLNSSTGLCESDTPAFVGGLYGLNEVKIPTPYDFKGPLGFG